MAKKSAMAQDESNSNAQPSEAPNFSFGKTIVVEPLPIKLAKNASPRTKQTFTAHTLRQALEDKAKKR